MSQPRTFVSHSHKDDAFTQRLVDDLHKAGAEVWVDVAGISHGNFMQRIDEALAQCAWTVLVLTPNAIASQYVKDEVYAALHRVKQDYMGAVIPVLAAPCEPGTIPPQWDVLQRYDATSDYGAALAGVLRAIGPTPSPISDPSSTPASPRVTESADDLVAHGKALVAKGHYTSAVAFFERASQLAPGSFDAWFNLGCTRGELQHWRKALAVYDRALPSGPMTQRPGPPRAVSS